MWNGWHSKKVASMVIYGLFVGGWWHLHHFWLGEYPRKTHLRALRSSLSIDYLEMRMKDTHPNIFGGSVPISLKLGKDFESTSTRDLKYKTQEDIRFIKNVVVKTTSPQYDFRTFIWKIKDLKASKRCFVFPLYYSILL